MSILCKGCRNAMICEAVNQDHPTATNKICSPHEVKAYPFTTAKEGTLRAVYTQCTLDAIEFNVILFGIPETKRVDIAARVNLFCPAEESTHDNVYRHWTSYIMKTDLAEKFFCVDKDGVNGKIYFDKDGNDRLNNWGKFKKKIGYQPTIKFP